MFKSFLMPIVFIAAAVGVVMLYGLSYYETIQNQWAELREYESVLETADQVAEVEAELEAGYNSFSEEERAQLAAMLPERPRMIEDVAEINNLAQETGVGISDISVGEAEENNILAQQDPLQTLSVTYSLTTDYPSFRSFLRSLESRLRVTDISAISFSAGGAGEEGSNFYDIELGTQAYWINQ